jgi:hypothetical protein
LHSEAVKDILPTGSTKLNLYVLISIDLKSKFDLVFLILELHAVPSGDAEFSLVEPMSDGFRSANERQEKIKDN